MMIQHMVKWPISTLWKINYQQGWSTNNNAIYKKVIYFDHPYETNEISMYR